MKDCKIRDLRSRGGHLTAGVKRHSGVRQVAYSHRCLDTLADWVRWAMSDRQTTILRLLLAVLLRLPIPPAMVHVGRLLKAIFGLQSYKCAPLSVPPARLTSQMVACAWRVCFRRHHHSALAGGTTAQAAQMAVCALHQKPACFQNVQSDALLPSDGHTAEPYA